MKKRMVRLLSLVLILFLAGCGKSEEIKTDVTKYVTVETTEKSSEALENERIAKVCETGKAALANMRIDEIKEKELTFYTPQSFPQYINERTYVLCYVGSSATEAWLRMAYNYCGERWVFWEKLTFLVDGKPYYRYFDSCSINRDNDFGKVWESVEFTADEEDLTLFEAIADSDETTIRFEGDTYYCDFVVSDEDKAAIKDALAVYEYLKISKF